MQTNQQSKSLKITNISPETTFAELCSTLKLPQSFNDSIKINYPYFHGTTTPKGYAFLTYQNEETTQYILNHYTNYYSHGKIWKIEKDIGLSQKISNGIDSLSSRLTLQKSIRQQYLMSIDWNQFYINKSLKYILKLSESKTVFLLLCLGVSKHPIIKLTHQLVLKKHQSKNIALCINSSFVNTKMIDEQLQFSETVSQFQKGINSNKQINDYTQNNQNKKNEKENNSFDETLQQIRIDERRKEKMKINQEISDYFHVTSFPCLLILEKGIEIQRGSLHQFHLFK